LLSFRYLYFRSIGEGQGHVQSVLLAILFLLLAFGSLIFGFVADILASVRRLLEEVLYRQRLLEERLDRLRPSGFGEPRRSSAEAARADRTR
jgi:hypothetical protein